MPGDVDINSLQDYSSASFQALAGPADQKNAATAVNTAKGLGKMTIENGDDGKPEKFKAEGHIDFINDLMKKVAEGAQLKHQVSQVEQILQGELAKVQTRENNYNRSPLLSAIANISGNLAASRDMPPLVQALGRSAVQLNPGPLALQGQKMNILSALDQAQRSSREEEDRSTEQLFRVAEFGQREQDKHDTQRLKKVEDVVRPITIAATAHRVVPDKTATVKALMDAGATKSEAEDQYNLIASQAGAAKQQYEDEQRTAQDNRKALVGARGEVQKDVASTKASLSLRNSLAVQGNGERLREDFKNYSEQIKKDDQLAIVPQKEKTELIGIRQTEKYLDDLEALLANPKLASKMGAFKLEQYAPIWAKSADQVQVQTQLAHETPRILQLILRGGQGGASILRTQQGRDMLKQLGVTNTMTPDQAKRVIGVLRQTLHNNRTSTMEAYPVAPWSDYPDLLGRDAGYAPKGGAQQDAKDPLGVR